MRVVCECCRGTGMVDKSLELQRLEREWYSYCLEEGFFVTVDGMVTAQTAADLLNLTKGYLENMRSAGRGPPFKKRGRVFYSLHDLAVFSLARE